MKNSIQLASLELVEGARLTSQTEVRYASPLVNMIASAARILEFA